MTTATTKNNEVNDKIATALYIGEASDATYFEVFTKQELVELWEGYCVYRVVDGDTVPPTASYDDEVFNALDRHGYWDNK